MPQSTSLEERTRPLCFVDVGNVVGSLLVKQRHLGHLLVKLDDRRRPRRLEQKALQICMVLLHHILLDVEDAKAVDRAGENLTK